MLLSARIGSDAMPPGLWSSVVTRQRERLGARFDETVWARAKEAWPPRTTPWPAPKYADSSLSRQWDHGARRVDGTEEACRSDEHRRTQFWNGGSCWVPRDWGCTRGTAKACGQGWTGAMCCASNLQPEACRDNDAEACPSREGWMWTGATCCPVTGRVHRPEPMEACDESPGARRVGDSCWFPGEVKREREICLDVGRERCGEISGTWIGDACCTTRYGSCGLGTEIGCRLMGGEWNAPKCCLRRRISTHGAPTDSRGCLSLSREACEQAAAGWTGKECCFP